jgi:hypothetical protein
MDSENAQGGGGGVREATWEAWEGHRHPHLGPRSRPKVMDSVRAPNTHYPKHVPPCGGATKRQHDLIPFPTRFDTYSLIVWGHQPATRFVAFPTRFVVSPLPYPARTNKVAS